MQNVYRRKCGPHLRFTLMHRSDGRPTDEIRPINFELNVAPHASGSVLVSLGPSFGEWLNSDEIPSIMKDAMISVEDRRFRWHPGVDPVGVLRGI